VFKLFIADTFAGVSGQQRVHGLRSKRFRERITGVFSCFDLRYVGRPYLGSMKAPTSLRLLLYLSALYLSSSNVGDNMKLYAP
jgi:hypothetical protein